MSFENLSEREKQVLAHLVDYYVRSADPVGSRMIANKFHMGLSPATIRNTLQDLEELGLVEQPHTSAGRVPTDTGYRFYVDMLLRPEPLNPAEKQMIRDTILREGRGISDILGQTARILGDITSQLGVTVAPKFESGMLHSLRLIPVADGKLMVIVIVDSGLARSVILEVETSMSDLQLVEVETILNERLAGLALSEIRDTVSQRLEGVSGNARLIQLVIDSKAKIWSDDRAGLLHVAGVDRLPTIPEFADKEKLSKLIKVLEEGRVLTEFLSNADHEGLVITIGRENRISEIVNCSLVTASYKVGNITGTIGIIGPTRMPYGKLVSVVEYTARSISEVLSGMNE